MVFVPEDFNAQPDKNEWHYVGSTDKPIVYDETLAPDILIEIRDQHGNSLGRIMAS